MNKVKKIIRLDSFITLFFSILVGLVACPCMVQGQGIAIPFSESFALSENREELIKQLVPGTNDYFFYRSLVLQQQNDLKEVDRLLKIWKSTFRNKGGFDSRRFKEIELRQTLLHYPESPKKSLKELKDLLQPNFHHQPESIRGEKKYPTSLHSKWSQFEHWRKRFPNIADLNDIGLHHYPSKNISKYDRRRLLSRVSLPDFPDVMKLIKDDLNSTPKIQFGHHKVHQKLSIKQMDQLLKAEPQLRSSNSFVNTYLRKLVPNNDTATWRDAKVKRQYLNDCWKFAETLPASFVSLKANLLYWQLDLDRQEGIFDLKRFKRYLAIPRSTFYINQKWQKNLRNSNKTFADFRYQPIVKHLERIRSDHVLVKFYLQYYLKDATDTKEFRSWIDEDYLKRTIAEVKLTSGKKDAKDWIGVFSPEKLKALNERVDLSFAPTTPKIWSPDQKVQLKVTTKGIQKLIVKVFRINAENYYRQYGTEVTTDINLDGLVPSFQKNYAFDTPSIKAVERKFDFPQCDKPGVFVIDFIGKGKSSRALIKKGKLEFFASSTPVGHRLVVLDNLQRIVKNSKIWIDGRWISSDKDGDILVPYTSKPKQKRIVVSNGQIASLGSLDHQAMQINFESGLLVNRESVLPNRESTILIRPTLHINGTQAPLELLSNSKLTIQAWNHGNTSKSKTVKVNLQDNIETSVPLKIQEDTRKISVSLSTTIKDPISGNDVKRTSQRTFHFNQIDSTYNTDQVLLVPSADGYFLEVRGKSGESRRNRVVNIQLTHLAFKKSATVAVQTDNKGRILLGDLTGIGRISVNGQGIPTKNFLISKRNDSFQNLRHVLAGKDFFIPYTGLTLVKFGKQNKAAKPSLTRADLALYEVRDDQIVKDFFRHIKYLPGSLAIKGLPPGDFHLHFKKDRRIIQIKVTQGKETGQFLVGKHRILKSSQPQVATVSEIQASERFVTIKLDNWTDGTRVHIFGNRYFPAFDSAALLAAGVEQNPEELQAGFQGSSYVTGRSIGDEYDYILRRKLAIKYPGLMLPKPSLLLNPFKVRQTNNQIQTAGLGGEFEKKVDSRGSSIYKPQAAKPTKVSSAGLADYNSLDFCGQLPIFNLQLKPNEDGIIRVPAKQFADKQFLDIVLVDGQQIQKVNFSFQALDLTPIDRRFHRTLDTSTHFSENKSVIRLNPNNSTVLHRSENPNIRVFHDLNSVFSYYRTVSGSVTLSKFRFITKWNQLSKKEKLDKYSQFACHELNFFLFMKDQKFFEKVIKPYLKNKYQKTFMDDFLLGQDLTSYLQPNRLKKLNYVERILLISRLEKNKESLTQAVSDQLTYLTDHTPFPVNQLDQFFFGGQIGFVDELKKLAESEDDEESSNEGVNRSKSRSEKNGIYFQQPGGGNKKGKSSGRFRGGRVAGGLQAGQNIPYFKNSAGVNSISAGKKVRFADRGLELGINLDRDGEIDKRKGYLELYSRKQSNGKLDQKSLGFVRKSLKKKIRRYQPVSSTYEWAENNYYHQRPGTEESKLVSSNRFWLDYCKHVGNNRKTPFLSENFLEVGNSFTELMFALAVTDLPLETEPAEVKVEEDDLTIKVSNASLAILRRLEKSKSNDPDTKILVSENFIRIDDPSITKNGIRYDKFVTDQYFTHVVYQGQVSVTNPTSSPRTFQLLVQIPEGSLAVNNGIGTKAVSVQLGAFATKTFKSYFYFPKSGKFRHYPAQVSQNQIHLANGKVRKFQVKTEVTKLDPNSWTYIAIRGTDDQVIEYLKKNNLWKTSLNKIYYRLRNLKFYERFQKILESKYFHDGTNDSYGLYHNKPRQLTRYLQGHGRFRSIVGPVFQSDWLNLDTQSEYKYHHKEYWPLVNSRVHQLSVRRKITNPTMFTQYNQLLERLVRKTQLDAEDQLAVCYYLLAQDRFEETIGLFSKIDRKDLASDIQFDYLKANLQMLQGDSKGALVIAKEHLEHPVNRWRERFTAIRDQIRQIKEPNATSIAEKSFGKDNLFQEHTDQSDLMTTAPSFEFEIRSDSIDIRYRNLAGAKINFYQIDLELLFSRNPFQGTENQSFDWVQPNFTTSVKLDSKKQLHKFAIPKQIRNRNVLVEVNAGGESQTIPYYSRSFEAQFSERFGQLRVMDKQTKKPVSKVYVKVYAKMANGKVQFFKDGYTDLRGRFDYVTQTNVPLANVQKLAVLVLSKDKGAFTKEVNPPAR